MSMQRTPEIELLHAMNLERLFRILLALAAVDSLAYALWAMVWPDGLFQHLDVPPHEPIEWKLIGVGLETADHILLWRVMGALFLAQACILAVVVWKPNVYGSMIVAALIGRLLPLGLWLWLLGTERVQLRAAPLEALAIHDGVWVLVFTVFLVLWLFRKPQV
jgi:hypothetical protein